jgi:hypothetical protein
MLLGSEKRKRGRAPDRRAPIVSTEGLAVSRGRPALVCVWGDPAPGASHPPGRR